MAMQKKAHRRGKLTLGMVAGAVLTGVLGGAVIAGARSEPTVYDESGDPVPHTQIDYPVNENGDTYGTAKDLVYLEDFPKLLRVLGDHGIEGYVYLDDVLGEAPASPEEAVRQQEARIQAEKDGTAEPRVLTVYAADGKTPLDTLTCG